MLRTEASQTIPVYALGNGEASLSNLSQYNTVIIPEGIQKINANALKEWSVNKIVISSSVAYIDATAFENSLNNIEVAEGSEYFKDFDENRGLMTADGKTILFVTVTNNSEYDIYDFEIPEGVENIPKGAIRNPWNLRLTIPASVKLIEENFVSEGIHSFIINEEGASYKTTDGKDLYTADGKVLVYVNLENVNELTIPAGVERIGDKALVNAWSLETITCNSVDLVDKALPTIEGYAWEIDGERVTTFVDYETTYTKVAA